MQDIITYSLLAVYIIAISIIGFISKNKNGSEDYFLASRKLPSWLLAITFIASWWGGGSAIDLADHAYNNGINSFWIYGVPVLLSTALMFLFAKAIRKFSTISQPQLMAQRYNQASALFLTIFILIFMILGSSVQVIVLGKFFLGYFGLDYTLGATLGVFAVIFYSLFGGFRGVVLTDFFQFIFFLLTTIVLLFVAYNGANGFSGLNQAVQEKQNPNYLNFFHDLSSNLAYVITFGSAWMIQANVWQRISAAKTPTSARKMMAYSFFAFIPLYLMVSLTGMFASTYYTEVPAGGIIPDMVKNLSSPILSAVLFIGLCSAIMSTLDSMINTASLCITVDFWQKYIKPHASPKSQIRVARISTFTIAMLALIIGINIQSVLTISWIGSDFITTGVFVPLVLGFIWKRGTTVAALSSMTFGLCFSLYNLLVAMGVNLPTAWKIASVEQAIIGISSSFIIYISVSLFSHDDNNKAENFVQRAELIK